MQRFELSASLLGGERQGRYLREEWGKRKEIGYERR